MAKTHDVATVAKALGVSPPTLLNWRARGIGPVWFQRGHRYFYKADQFQEYLDRIGPIPEGLDLWSKRRFFEKAHHPEETPEQLAEDTPKQDAALAATVAELKRRLEVIEVAVVLLGGSANG